MGADFYNNTVIAPTAKEAFQSAVETAQWEHGHGGYTGTIAEKAGDGFVMVPADRMPIPLVQPVTNAWLRAFINAAQEAEDFEDKWGPAFCVDIGPSVKKPGERQWLFFGYASS
jgi:hypothetical protein